MYTKMYTIFCRIYGVVWYCIISFCGVTWANTLKYRDFGFSWNYSISTVLVPVSPQNSKDKKDSKYDKSRKIKVLRDFLFLFSDIYQ